MRTLTFLIALVLSASIFAQEIPLGLHVLPDGRMVVMAYDMEIGEFLVTSEASQGPAQPSFSSSWTDTDGVDHEVTTPVVGGGATGMRKAFETHRQMVLLMQRAYRPRPVRTTSANITAELTTIFEFFQLQGPQPPADTGPPSKITTQWVSAGNMGHVIETPVPNPVTAAGIGDAVRAHLDLVTALQQAFPPIPISGSGGMWEGLSLAA